MPGESAFTLCSRGEEKGDGVSFNTYCITIEGELDDVAAAAFPDLHLDRAEGTTRLRTAALDQAGLNGLLDRLRMIRADLVSVVREVSISPV